MTKESLKFYSEFILSDEFMDAVDIARHEIVAEMSEYFSRDAAARDKRLITLCHSGK